MLDPTNINDPNVTLNHEHREYLCITCYNDEHIGGAMMREDLHFDEHGQLVDAN